MLERRLIRGVGVAGQAFGAGDAVEHPRQGRLDRASRLLLSAAQQARPHDARGTLGIFVATRHGAIDANAKHWELVSKQGLAAVSPLIFPATVPSAAAGEAAIALGAMGPNVTLCADPRAIVALAHAALREGECDEALVGAVCGWHPMLPEPATFADGALCAWLGEGLATTKRLPSHANRFFSAFLEALNVN